MFVLCGLMNWFFSLKISVISPVFGSFEVDSRCFRLSGRNRVNERVAIATDVIVVGQLVIDQAGGTGCLVMDQVVLWQVTR